MIHSGRPGTLVLVVKEIKIEKAFKYVYRFET